MSSVLVGVGSFVGASEVFFLFYYLLCERLFLGTALSDCFRILSKLFILIYMEGKVSGEHSSWVDFL